jgi:membrane protease YdiL (CAAX protease family)
MLVAARRILLLPLFRLLWTLLLVAGAMRIVAWLFPNLAELPAVALAGSARNALLITTVLALSLWLFEGRGLRDVGLAPRRAIPETAWGFLIGAALLTAVVGILALVGSYHLVGWVPVPEGTTRGALLLRVVLLFFCVAVFEELGVRGIVFRLLEQGLGTWLAIAISALLFGFGHRHNPGATLLSSIAIAIEAGMLLAAMYVATRSLWLPIGGHWAWNLFEGPVWGSAVSGNELSTLAEARFPGPTLLTGGGFGPEAGLPALVLGGALGIAFLVLAVRRGQIVTPGWMWRLLDRVRPPALPEPAPLPGQTPSGPGVEGLTGAGQVDEGRPAAM